ncbi:ankyrin repeat domain-containing protein [bacterium]|nr:ankyrin repeat domain-containing protein [bacterium]
MNKADDDDDWTPLFVDAGNDHLSVVRMLIEAGTAINKAIDIGGTPLFIAAQYGLEAVV